MRKVKVCPECGVPKRISRKNRWQDNGAILTFDSDKATARERSAFYEVDGLNGLFQNIEASIGQSIFRIIVEARRKDILGFLEEVLSGKPGSIHFDRCKKCNTPLYMKDIIYDYEEGIITDKKTGRRMTFLSTSNMEAIFRELELHRGRR